MSLDALIMLTGAIVAVLPFLGFPPEWKTVLYFIAGMLVVAFGIVVRRRGNPASFERKNVSRFTSETPVMTEDEGAMMGN